MPIVFIGSLLILGLEEEKTALKGREQGRLIRETRGENAGYSWRLFPIEYALQNLVVVTIFNRVKRL